jgi:uncharacterized membrane protein YgcG
MYRHTITAVMIICALTDIVSAETSYKPEDAYVQMVTEVRKLIEPTPVPGNWFSITAIGAVAEADDPNAINELANFCPDVSREIVRFGGIRPIDLIYEKAIDSMVAPVFTETQGAKDAKIYIRGTSGTDVSNEYKAYQKYLAASTVLLKSIITEKDSNKVNSLLIDYRNNERDWKVQGYKDEVEAALFQIDASDGLFGPVHNFHRKEVLNTFRNNGVTSNWQIGSYNSPASEVSPPVADWENESGWFEVKFESKTYDNSSGSSSGSQSSGGFLHIGGLVGGGSNGGGNSSSWSINQIQEYGYTFQLKRIRIVRKWLDPRVFSTVGGWAWTKRQSASDYPLISGGYNAENQPISPEFVVYDNLPVDCPMIPSEMLIARKRTITLTTSRDDYNSVVSSGSSSGGGMFGGIIGGRKSRSWTTTEIHSSGNSVTFKVEAPGTAVIGLTSQLVGKLPAPNSNANWPADAWIEGTN